MEDACASRDTSIWEVDFSGYHPYDRGSRVFAITVRTSCIIKLPGR